MHKSTIAKVKSELAWLNAGMAGDMYTLHTGEYGNKLKLTISKQAWNEGGQGTKRGGDE